VSDHERRPRRQLVADTESESKVSNVNTEGSTDSSHSTGSPNAARTREVQSPPRLVSPDEKQPPRRADNKLREEGRFKKGLVVGSPEWFAEWNRVTALLKGSIAHLQQEHKKRFQEMKETKEWIRKSGEELVMLRQQADEIEQDPFYKHIKKTNELRRAGFR